MSLEYVYHIRSTSFIGEVLFPLNELKEISLESYNKHSKKYDHRKYLMDCPLKIAHCLWNDVIHLCPIDIAKILDERIRYLGKEGKSHSYFKIPFSFLDEAQTFFLYRKSTDDHLKEDLYKEINENVYPYSADKKDPQEIFNLNLQIEYFQKCSKDPLLLPYLFTGITHVLYKGSLDISSCEILTKEY